MKAEPGVDVTVCPATTLTNRRVITGGAARASTGKNETGGAGVSELRDDYDADQQQAPRQTIVVTGALAYKPL